MKTHHFFNPSCGRPNLAGRAGPHLHWPWEIWPRFPCGLLQIAATSLIAIGVKIGMSYLELHLQKDSHVTMIVVE